MGTKELKDSFLNSLAERHERRASIRLAGQCCVEMFGVALSYNDAEIDWTLSFGETT